MLAIGTKVRKRALALQTIVDSCKGRGRGMGIVAETAAPLSDGLVMVKWAVGNWPERADELIVVGPPPQPLAAASKIELPTEKK